MNISLIISKAPFGNYICSYSIYMGDIQLQQFISLDTLFPSSGDAEKAGMIAGDDAIIAIERACKSRTYSVKRRI